MNPQFTKEFRTLVLPWCVAVLMAILMQFGNFLAMVHVIESGPFVSFVLGLMVFAFFASLLAMAALPFGTEFQHRTLPLLFSQPIARSRIWRQKLLAALLGIGTGLLVLALASIIADKGATAAMKPKEFAIVPITPTVESTVPAGMSREQAEMYQRRYGINHIRIESTQGNSRSVRPIEDLPTVSHICLVVCALLLPTIGSVTFWTLLARSTLGGMVFTAFAQLVAGGILAFIAERLGLPDKLGIRDLSTETAILALASVIYAGIFFALSWQKFSRLELSQLLPDTLAGSKSLSARGLRLNLLRCRATSGSRNLIRKEIQLQRPLLIIAAILCVLWAVVYVFLTLQPQRTNFPEIIFALTIGFYLPLMSLLAGCISLGEEKNFGINGWQLTLPISARRQWGIKLSVSLSTWLILGALLPFGLVSLGGAMSNLQFYKEMEPQGWLGLSLFMTCVFVFSFWAMTLFDNTVRAVIGGIAIVVLLCSAAAFAYWIMIKWILPHTFLQTMLVYDSDWQGSTVSMLVGGTTVLLGLLQSLTQFRQLRSSPKVIFLRSFGLVVFIFLGTICYFLTLPISEHPMPIYLMLFVLMLTFLRQKAAPFRQGANS
jgi:hypothetical protein